MIRCYITDRTRGDIVATSRRLIGEGIEIIQVREKDLGARALLEIVKTIVTAARGSATRVLVNDRLDVALAAGADGVHLPANGIPASLIRPHVDFVGVSTHTTDEVRQAEQDGADYVAFGPIFETPGKTPIGLAALEDAAKAVRIPVLAIGGITPRNVSRARAAGAAGIAAIRMFQGTED